LWVQRVILASEGLGQIGIALPVRVDVAVIQTREAVKLRPVVSRESAVRKGIAVGVPDHFSRRSGISHEIPFARRIAPSALGVPMPGLHEQIRVLAITDHAPPRRKDLLDLIRPKKHFGGIARYPVYGRTKGIHGAELVHHM